MTSTKRVLILVMIAVVVCLLLSFCAPDVPEGTIVGKGHDFTNNQWYLIVQPDKDCTDCESVAVRVTEEEYNNYDTGDFYTGE